MKEENVIDRTALDGLLESLGKVLSIAVQEARRQEV